jgi:hypothetical protein
MMDFSLLRKTNKTCLVQRSVIFPKVMKGEEWVDLNQEKQEKVIYEGIITRISKHICCFYCLDRKTANVRNTKRY